MHRENRKRCLQPPVQLAARTTGGGSQCIRKFRPTPPAQRYRQPAQVAQGGSWRGGEDTVAVSASSEIGAGVERPPRLRGVASRAV